MVCGARRTQGVAYVRRKHSRTTTRDGRKRW